MVEARRDPVYLVPLVQTTQASNDLRQLVAALAPAAPDGTLACRRHRSVYTCLRPDEHDGPHVAYASRDAAVAIWD